MKITLGTSKSKLVKSQESFTSRFLPFKKRLVHIILGWRFKIKETISSKTNKKLKIHKVVPKNIYFDWFDMKIEKYIFYGLKRMNLKKKNLLNNANYSEWIMVYTRHDILYFSVNVSCCKRYDSQLATLRINQTEGFSRQSNFLNATDNNSL